MRSKNGGFSTKQKNHESMSNFLNYQMHPKFCFLCAKIKANIEQFQKKENKNTFQ